jgi:hypothetical protein
MMFAAEWGVGQVFWSMLWFFLFFMWIWLVITIFSDLIRDRSLSGVAKVLWSIFIIFVPYLGVFVYLIARGGSMTERAIADAQARDAEFRSYVKETAGGASAASELATLADLHERGKLDDAEFAALKAKVLAS